MKNAIQELRKETLNLSITDHPVLQSILSLFRDNTQESSEIDFIPGSFYAHTPPDVTQEDMDFIFTKIISSDSLMASNEKLCSQIIAHIASFSFPYFVETLAPQFFQHSSLPLQFIAANVSRIILDPTTGFLKNSPHSPNNDSWGDDEYNFNFFDSNSPDLQTPFGQALNSFRKMVFDQIHDFFTDTSLITDNPEKAVFVPSVFVSVQTSVIPPSFTVTDISCGFPLRTEILLEFSKFQDQTVYTKDHDLSFTMTETVTEWSEAFSNLFNSSPMLSPVTLSLYKGTDCSHDLKMKFSKLILFINPGISVQIPDDIFQYIMKFILGGNLSLSAFYIMLAQELLFIYPDFSFLLFDSIFEAIRNKSQLSNNQYFTLMVTITRFVDVLSLLPTRYLDDSQIETLFSVSLIGLCSIEVGIRYISFKVARSLGNFEANNEFVNIYKFVNDNSAYFEQYLYNIYENCTSAFLSESNTQVLSPLPFKESMLSSDILLWQYTLAALGVFICQQFPKNFKKMIKQSPLENLDKNQLNNIHCLTFLASLTDLKEEDEETHQINISIIEQLINITRNNLDKHFSLLYAMISPLPESSFQLCLDLLSENFEPVSISVFLYSMAWNPNFVSITKEGTFFSTFINLFLQVCEHLRSLDSELMEVTLDNFIESQIELLDTHTPFILNLLSCFYQILNTLYQHNSVHFNSPFPCTNFVIDTENTLIRQTQQFFPLLYNLSNECFSEKVVQQYALKTLELWYACNSIAEMTFLCSEQFYSHLLSISKSSLNILVHLLSHHFDVLFSVFLENSLQPDRENFFDAIATFFRSPLTSSDTLPLDILKSQWRSSIHQDSQSSYAEISFTKYLKSLYENVGTFIFSCLLYMTIPNSDLNDKAFITLCSLTPIIYFYHTDGREDSVKPLLDVIVSICEKVGQRLSNLDSNIIYTLSNAICERFQFCMEQVMYSMLTNLPKFDFLTIDRVLYILMPWFSSIHFDIENRVISKETDLRFIRFSCFSFVEMMVNAFAEIANDDINSSLFSVWKALATEDGEHNSNFLSIVISVIYLVSSKHYHKSAYVIIRYMYRISPKIIDILSSYLSFSFNANQSYINILDSDQETDVNFMNSNASDSPEDSQNTKFVDSTVIDFILKTLTELAHESVRPLIQFFPVIFSYCVVNLDLHFELIYELLKSILNELLPYLENETVPYLNEVLRMISSLPTFYPAVATLVDETLFVAEKKLIQSIPFTDRAAITRAITQFFQSIEGNMAQTFGLEILKWGLCSFDLYRASFAMICYRGNLTDTSTLLIGLISRSLWNAFDAIAYLYNEYKEESTLTMYVRYISECYKTLEAISLDLIEQGTIGSHQNLLWLAIEGLNCNVSCVSPIFDHALSLLSVLLYPELFDYINGKSEYTTLHYPQSIFTKYHQPWGDTFKGCIKAIFEYHCPQPNISRMISVINKIVQTCCPCMFSLSDAWAYTALLSLIPWMWSVVITDISRFFFSSPAVQSMEETSMAFSNFLNDEPVSQFLSNLLSDEEIDIFSEVEAICKFIIPFIPFDDLLLVANFFTNCIIYGEKTLKMPLYSVVTHMINNCQPDKKELLINSFQRFTPIVLNDKKSSRKTFVKMYFEAIGMPLEDKSFNIGDPHLFYSNENLKMASLESFSSRDFPSSLLSKVSSSVPLTREAIDPPTFPKLPLFERIVAVDIPHLFDFTSTEAQSITLLELNSFPPLFSNDQMLKECPKFKLLRGLMKYIKVEPFASWNELIIKLHTSLIDSTNIEAVQRFKHLGAISIGNIFLNIIQPPKTDEAPEEEEKVPEVELDMEQYQQEGQLDPEIENLFLESDPFSFIFLRPMMFVPTVDEANFIGADMMNDEMDYA